MLQLGKSVQDVADARGLNYLEADRLCQSDRVQAALRRLEHGRQGDLTAAHGVLLDRLPEVLETIVSVAVDPEHKQWGLAAKLYMDRVMPTVIEGAVHHTHELGGETRERLEAASHALERLVDGLAPQLEQFTGLGARTIDISSRVLRGDAAKPTPLALAASGPAEDDNPHHSTELIQPVEDL